MPHEECSLLAKTKECLLDCKKDLLIIHKESGIPYHWLKKFKAGGIPDPSVNRVQKLYEFLTNSKLEV